MITGDSGRFDIKHLFLIFVSPSLYSSLMTLKRVDGTALSIARRLGIPLNASRSSCLTGHDIESMSDKQLEEVIGSISVFSRTTPRHKLAIVRAFQAKGAIVAMTGDGGLFTKGRELMFACLQA